MAPSCKMLLKAPRAVHAINAVMKIAHLAATTVLRDGGLVPGTGGDASDLDRGCSFMVAPAEEIKGSKADYATNCSRNRLLWRSARSRSSSDRSKARSSTSMQTAPL